MTGRSSSIHHRQAGAVLVVAMIFIFIFSALAVSMATMANSNTQVAHNQHSVNSALLAAQSGLEVANVIVMDVDLPSTDCDTIRPVDVNNVLDCLEDYDYSGQFGLEASTSTIAGGQQTTIPAASVDGRSTFTIQFTHDPADPNTIRVTSTGADGPVTRTVAMDMKIAKGAAVLTYGIASRGRMWLTGDTTIHGPIYSSWNVASISPFNMTSESSVDGSINTVLTLDQIQAEDWQLETLNGDDQPMDGNGAPLGTHYDDRYYGPSDEIQGYHEGINYGQPDCDYIPGMQISDYNTASYKSMVNYINNATVDGSLIHDGKIPASTTTVPERFPHGTTGYNSGTGLQVTRHVYENKTFRDVFLPSIKNTTTNRRAALFSNCTFEGVLYVDCSQTSSTLYNNVRFDNCTFNGVIVSNTPQSLWWQQNCLYFTGAAAFNNQSSVQTATILAPHFNVNLGNANSDQDDNNVLTGAIVGGIVDVRGNAQIYGTIISMANTECYSSGYVTNIGATLDDGGSETTTVDDIGTIDITPPADKRLPSGITTPIVIDPDHTTYDEEV